MRQSLLNFSNKFLLTPCKFPANKIYVIFPSKFLRRLVRFPAKSYPVIFPPKIYLYRRMEPPPPPMWTAGRSRAVCTSSLSCARAACRSSLRPRTTYRSASSGDTLWTCSRCPPPPACNQCCGSGMFIPDPDFYPSRIQDPKKQQQKRGGEKFVVMQFL